MSNVSDFEKYWNKFTTKLKGALMGQMRNQPLTHSAASIVLSDIAMAWSLSYDDCGRWLLEYTQENPEKGAIITQILTQDMGFTEIPESKNFPEIAKIAAPAAGAVLGFGISHFLNASILIQAISTIAPAALIYPVTKNLGESVKTAKQEILLNDYMEQLEKYRKSVLSVINEYE